MGAFVTRATPTMPVCLASKTASFPPKVDFSLLFGSSTWKRLYHRARNASESRNATFERWNLRRLPAYGALRGKALIFLADVWSNLTTLARLCRQATAASGA